jgi:4'-phosphopantetheinyl transferase
MSIVGWYDHPLLPPRSTLPAVGDCHLWPLALTNSKVSQYLLDEHEHKIAQGLRLDSARRTFLHSRTYQRLVLAHYVGRPPAAIRIDRRCEHCGDARHGRPRLTSRLVEYSVSHSRSWLLIAIVRTGLVGIDIEEEASLSDIAEVSELVLAAQERQQFAHVQEADRPQWLMRRWIRKEAALKATGMGLRVAPNLVDVTTSDAQSNHSDWPRSPVHLYELPAPQGLAAALASTAAIESISICGPLLWQ